MAIFLFLHFHLLIYDHRKLKYMSLKHTLLGLNTVTGSVTDGKSTLCPLEIIKMILKEYNFPHLCKNDHLN